MLDWVILLFLPPIIATTLIVLIVRLIKKIFSWISVNLNRHRIALYTSVIFLSIPAHIVGVVGAFIINGYKEKLMTGKLPEYGYAISGLYAALFSTVIISICLSIIIVRKQAIQAEPKTQI